MIEYPDGVEQANDYTVVVRGQASENWDPFVDSQMQASIYLKSGWALLAREVFGHDVWFIEALDSEGQVRGVLPIVHQKTFLGNFATSLAFFNYGGPLCASEPLALRMMEYARHKAELAGCEYLEFRDVILRSGWSTLRTDKISMVMQLPQNVEALARQLGAKLRSQIKRADREGVVVRTGGVELLNGFYDVFCRNMRDLGTPVYPRKFFQAILERFSSESLLIVIERNGCAAAAAFLLFANGRAEIPWAACREDAKPAGINMRLYWEALSVAISRECRQFDFGRSTRDSGTFRFKKQWGAQPQQLYWYRWERSPQLESVQGEPGRRGVRHYASVVWRHLPLGIANKLGPLVSPGLPW